MCAHLVVDLNDLDEDRERQTEEHVGHHGPAAGELFVHTDRRNEPLP